MISRPLNFLHVTTFYPPYSFGGDAIYVYRLAHALGDRGHNVDVVHCVDSYRLSHPGPPEVTFRDHPNVRVHPIMNLLGPLSPLLSHQSGYPILKKRFLLSLAAQKPFDVVHFHNISLLGPAVFAIPPPSNEAVKLYTAHDYWMVCPTSVLWKFGRRACDTPQCIRCSILAGRPIQLWRYSQLLAKCARHVDLYLAPSRFAADMLAKRGLGLKFEVLPCFADPGGSPERKVGARPHEARYFLFVGRLETLKGVQTLIDVWRRVRSAHLLIVGTGSQAEQLRRRAGSNPAIRFVGAVAPDELAPYYSHAEAVLAPSLTYETFGMSVIEGFAHATPVIAREIGALAEIVRESGGGLLCRNDDELLEAVERIVSSDGLRSELGEKGRAAFTRSWSPQAHLTRYFELLERITVSKFGRVPWKSALKPHGTV